MSALIDDIIKLTREGWRPYRGVVPNAVYETLGCPCGVLGKRETRIRPYWFSRADIYVCVGCSKKCGLNRPAGFQPVLEVNYPYDPEKPFTLTPEELVTSKSSLRADEAAYCLNCSVRTVYKFVSLGKLVGSKERPIRIRTQEVAAMMHDWDE